MVEQKIIEVKDLSVAFEGKTILSGVSFPVYSGIVTAILGGSGSGKTTVLRHILGLHPVEPGKITVLGKDISVLDEDAQNSLYMKMGVFYQNGGLLSSLTVGENVALPLEQHTNLPYDIISKIVKMKLSLVNLEHTYKMHPSQLSGGMFKRAALARAIVMDPLVLFCDEPGAGLDPVSLASLDQLLLDLKKLMKMSIILVTHEVSSILRIADRVIFLENAKVLLDGTLSDALKSKNESIVNFFDKGKGK